MILFLFNFFISVIIGYDSWGAECGIKQCIYDVTLQMCEEAGTDFAQGLKKVKKVRSPSQPATATEQAVGRVRRMREKKKTWFIYPNCCKLKSNFCVSPV